jgi:hypothetical protein
MLNVLFVPLQGAFALTRAHRSAGGERAPRNPCYTLRSSARTGPLATLLATISPADGEQRNPSGSSKHDGLRDAHPSYESGVTNH